MATSASEELPFTPEELAMLERGEVLLRHEGKELADGEVSSLLIGAVLVNHPIEVIWEVLNYPEREKDWIPGVKQSEVVSCDCLSPTKRRNVTDYRLGAWGIEVYYSLVREYDYEAKTISGYMDKERPHRLFEDIRNGWNFYPYRDGVIFQYWSDSKLSFELPSFISEPLAQRSIIAGIAEVAKRCDAVADQMKNRDDRTIPNPCASGEGTEKSE